MPTNTSWRRAVAGCVVVAASGCVTSSPRGTALPASAQRAEPVVIIRPETEPVRAFGPIRAPVAMTIGARISAHVRNTGSSRSLTSVFSVDQDAYVLVAHLGADGRIRVMYPGSPGDRALMKAGEQIETQPMSVPEDRTSNGYAQQITRTRTLQAVYDSYDGRGIGYVFIIASTDPLNTADFADGDRWTWLVATNYQTAPDPRLEIRELAEQIAAPALAGTAGATYTLEFATSSRTIVSSLTSYADYVGYDDYSSADCTMYGSGFSPFAMGMGWALVPTYGIGRYGMVTSPFMVNWALVPLSLGWGSPMAGYYGRSYGADSYGCGYGSGFYVAGVAPPWGVRPPAPAKPDSVGGRRLGLRDSSRSRSTPPRFYPRDVTPQRPEAASHAPATTPRTPVDARPTPTHSPQPRTAPAPRAEVPHAAPPPAARVEPPHAAPPPPPPPHQSSPPPPPAPPARTGRGSGN